MKSLALLFACTTLWSLAAAWEQVVPSPFALSTHLFLAAVSALAAGVCVLLATSRWEARREAERQAREAEWQRHRRIMEGDDGGVRDHVTVTQLKEADDR